MSDVENVAILERLLVVGIASSAGGLNALSLILATLPIDFAATIVVVQHLSPKYPC